MNKIKNMSHKKNLEKMTKWPLQTLAIRIAIENSLDNSILRILIGKKAP